MQATAGRKPDPPVAARWSGGLGARGLDEISRATMFPLAFANRSLDPEVIDVLIESVLVDNERVRRAALNGLKSHVGNDDVRALFETLQEEEPEFADELRIAETLRRHERQLELPPAR